jgi:hypothetical protein
MPRAPIVFPLTSRPGGKRQESAGRVINGYAEPLGEGARSDRSLRRVPGMASFATSDESAFRGMIHSGGTLYLTYGSTIRKVSNIGGAALSHGSFSGSAKCFFARNNNATPDVVVVDPNNGARIITSVGVFAYPDADVGSPNGVTFGEGFFFFTDGAGTCRASGLNTTSINTSEYITAEGKPDSLLRPVYFNGVLYLFGTDSIEIWSSGGTPNATGFPLNRLQILSRGLAGRYAMAGHEDGFGSVLIFVGSDNGVHTLSGGSINKISTPDLDRLIAAVEDKDTLEAGVYVSQGRPVFVLSSDTWTQEFNLNSLQWSERASGGLSRWRGTQPYYVFDKWLCGDVLNGNVYEIDADTRTEAGLPLMMTATSAPIQGERMRLDRIDIDITVGVGNDAGTTTNQRSPNCELSVSLNGGESFGAPVFIPLGERGKWRQKISAGPWGRIAAAGAVIRVAVSDDVDFGLLGGQATINP